MISPLGYLTENSRTPYPFKDNTGLVPIGLTTSLPTDVFLDFQFTAVSPNLKKIALTSIEYADLTHALSLSFAVFSLVNNSWVRDLISVTYIDAGIASEFLATFTSTYGVGKIIFGAGIDPYLNSKHKSSVFNTMDVNNLQAEFNPSTLISPVPSVSSVSFSNVKDVSPVVSVDLTTTPVVTMNGGYNVLGDNTGGVIGLAVGKGLGLGLYPCALDPIDGIKTVNGVRPNQNDDFLFTTDDCFKTVPQVSLTSADGVIPGVKLLHTCSPKCSQVEVSSFAYYANRVRDGLLKMGTYANTITATAQAKIDAYKRQLDYPSVVSPYIEVQDSALKVNNRQFVSFGLGVYDPNKEKLQLDLTVKPTNGIITDIDFANTPSWVNWVLHSGASLEEQNSKYILSPTITEDHSTLTLFSSRGIDCRGSVVASALLSTPDDSEPYKAIEFNLVQKNSSHVLVSSAYKYHNVLPTGVNPWFNVRARRGIKYNKTTPLYFIHTVAIDLFNPVATTGKTTGMLVIINNNTQYIFEPGEKAVLKINNDPSKTRLINISGDRVLLGGATIDYPQKAVLTLTLRSTDMAAPKTLDLYVSLSVDVHSTMIEHMYIQ